MTNIIDPVIITVPAAMPPEQIITNPVQIDAQSTTSIDTTIPTPAPMIITTNPYTVDAVQPTVITSFDPAASGSSSGLSGLTLNTQASAVAQTTTNTPGQGDWRVRLALAPGATYLYKSATAPGILQPLQQTDGVIFPYTPSINVAYAANYESASLVHTNYKMFQYTNSSVDSVTISCDFTCQDAAEANYLLACIHFFRSMTKMFYGQDQSPRAGTPPPLCFMYGMGGYQFANHPLAISGFTYALPPDVDYIKTIAQTIPGGPAPVSSGSSSSSPSNNRMATIIDKNVAVGGTPAPPNFPTSPSANPSVVTWVPTKIQLSVSCYPITSRAQMSNLFSLAEYASGNLFNGTNNTNGGFW